MIRLNLLVFSGHYVENTGNTTLTFLEIFKTGTRPFRCALHIFNIPIDRFQDISLNQVRDESNINSMELIVS
jgi:hypothetical protein